MGPLFSRTAPAGKFTIAGDEPNEVIEMEMVGGQSRQFKIVSLSPTQLVIAEGNTATTLRRPGKSAERKRSSHGIAGAPAHTADGDRTANSQGVLGSLLSFFTKWKCPNCGQRSGERISEGPISDVQQRVANEARSQQRPDSAGGRQRMRRADNVPLR